MAESIPTKISGADVANPTITIPVISGDILLNGKNIVGVAPDKAIKQGISYVPQTHNIFPNLTITENLEMGEKRRIGKVRKSGKFEKS